MTHGESLSSEEYNSICLVRLGSGSGLRSFRDEEGLYGSANQFLHNLIFQETFKATSLICIINCLSIRIL